MPACYTCASAAGHYRLGDTPVCAGCYKRLFKDDPPTSADSVRRLEERERRRARKRKPKAGSSAQVPADGNAPCVHGRVGCMVCQGLMPDKIDLSAVACSRCNAWTMDAGSGWCHACGMHVLP